MEQWLNITGLLLNLIGVVLVFRYGMPFRIKTDGKAAVTLILPDRDSDVALERRYATLGYLGLIFMVIGTCLQITASMMG